MAETKNADYYFNLLKEKGLKSDEFNTQRFFPSSENEYFPDEKVFMNWLIEWDYTEFRSIGDMLFSFYMNPSSGQSIIVNRYIKEKNKEKEVSDIIDECTEKSINNLSVLLSLRNFSIEEMINMHNKEFESILGLKEKIADIIKAAGENLRKTKENEKKDHYIG